jgi:hypothetical protein
MAARSDGWFVFAELACTVVLPSVVLLTSASPDRLGPTLALVLALAPPAAWAVVTQVRERRVSGLAVIALLSVAVSGGIGLAAVDARWFAVKEAVVPAGLGLLILGTAPTRLSLVPVLLDRILDRERTRTVLSARGTQVQFDTAARRATVVLGLVTLGSAIGSFLLAQALVVSPAGSEAFATELGRYTALSFPAVTLPVLVGSVLVLRRVLISLEEAAGTALEELMR